MSRLNNFLESLRDSIIGPHQASPDEVNLHMTKEAFATRMLQEPEGQAMLDLLQDGEWRICERMGLCNGYIDDETAYIDVTNWRNLVSHLQICLEVFSDNPE